MAEEVVYATGIDRNRYGAASGVLDALAAARPPWWADAMCRAYPELD